MKPLLPLARLQSRLLHKGRNSFIKALCRLPSAFLGQEFKLLNQVYDEISVKVLRDGSFTTIPCQGLVVGDIVYVEQGEQAPANEKVVEEVSLYIDQSKITGESEPVRKFSKANAEVHTLDEGTYPAFKGYRGTIRVMALAISGANLSARSLQ
ncbi:MAG TPA: hypothetical protein V6D14_17235 [Coleofasciculaceae cyanobacterium]